MVDLVERKCLQCTTKFKTTLFSKELFCKTWCKDGYRAKLQMGRQTWLAHLKQLEETASIRNLSSESSCRTQFKESSIEKEEENPTIETKTKSVKEADAIIEPTKMKSTTGEKSTPKQTGSEKMRFNEPTTVKISKKTEEEKESVETSETQLELSDGQLQSLNQEGLGLLSLSKKSANRLYDMMKKCVKDSDLSEDAEISQENMDLAIRCANGIAQIMQSNVNLFKVMKQK